MNKNAPPKGANQKDFTFIDTPKPTKDAFAIPDNKCGVRITDVRVFLSCERDASVGIAALGSQEAAILPRHRQMPLPIATTNMPRHCFSGLSRIE